MGILLKFLIIQNCGDVKEIFDFPKNLIRGLPLNKAISDFKHDMSVNHYGLYRGLTAEEGEDAQEACQRYRVNGINSRY